MAKAKPKVKPVPPIANRWKPGQSGNPLGGKLVDPDIRRLKNLTKTELVEIGTLVVKGDVKSLKAIAASPTATVIQTMIAAVAVRIISKGDMAALDALLNRLIGKVRDEVLHTGNVPQVVVTLPSNGREMLNEPPKKIAAAPADEGEPE